MTIHWANPQDQLVKISVKGDSPNEIRRGEKTSPNLQCLQKIDDIKGDI